MSSYSRKDYIHISNYEHRKKLEYCFVPIIYAILNTYAISQDLEFKITFSLL